MSANGCQERAQLSTTVKQSVDAVYALKETGKHSELLKAREALSVATKALEAHVNEHGCQP